MITHMKQKATRLKLALIGYGKMGKMVEKAATERGHAVIARVDSQGIKSHLPAIQASDICVDFSHPTSVLSSLERIAPLGKQIVIGTTGWLNHLSAVEKLVDQKKLGIIYAPNFSLGVFLFQQIVDYAASLINPFPEYDVGGFECHHNQKADAPSGTAKTLGKILLDRLERKKSLVYDLGDRPRKPEELQISTLRYGSVPGTHTIAFDSPADSITLTHQARSREGFASGAVRAAEWIKGKQGLFTLDDMMLNLLKEKE